MNQSQINYISHGRPLALCFWLRIVNIKKNLILFKGDIMIILIKDISAKFSHWGTNPQYG